MAEIDRFNGNLRAFGADAISTERTVFGDVTQSDALDDNINSDFFRGWGIVGPSENPTKQDFNAMGFTLGQLLAYLFQRGVAEWNVAQEYYAPAIVTHAGGLWLALSDNTGSEPPSADWARVDPGGLWKFTGVISPAQITSNQNNYNPAGLSGAFTVRLDANAARDITGLAGGEPGRVIELRNVSAFPITLVNESGSSSAANRFAIGANAPLRPNRSALLIYDGTLSRWRSIVAIDDLANYLPLAGGTMTGPIAMGSNKITGLGNGTNSGDAVNKGQMDAAIPAIANQSENEAGTVNTKTTTPLGIRQALQASGAAPIFACRAWVNFNGTGTVAIRASGNVSSITDNGTGRYRINFATAMPDANYAAIASEGEGVFPSVTGNDTGIFLGEHTTTSVNVYIVSISEAATDKAFVSVAIFR